MCKRQRSKFGTYTDMVLQFLEIKYTQTITEHHSIFFTMPTEKKYRPESRVLPVVEFQLSDPKICSDSKFKLTNKNVLKGLKYCSVHRIAA